MGRRARWVDSYLMWEEINIEGVEGGNVHVQHNLPHYDDNDNSHRRLSA